MIEYVPCSLEHCSLDLEVFAGQDYDVIIDVVNAEDVAVVHSC